MVGGGRGGKWKWGQLEYIYIKLFQILVDYHAALKIFQALRRGMVKKGLGNTALMYILIVMSECISFCTMKVVPP